MWSKGTHVAKVIDLSGHYMAPESEEWLRPKTTWIGSVGASGATSGPNSKDASIDKRHIGLLPILPLTAVGHTGL